MKKASFIILISMIGLLSQAIGQTKNSTVEITTTDITLNPNLKSDQISVFGIKLGMSKADVNKLLKDNSRLYYYVDEKHTTQDHRIYVYDKDEQGEKKNCILYLIWADNSNKLTTITFFENFAPYLKGTTAALLTFDPLDPDSKISKDYLGKPDSSKVTLDVAIIHLKHTTYYYKAKGIQFTLKESDGEKTSVFQFYL
ncbi:MAG: hypothetical protein ACJ75J_03785 [Cytophagaceae bacterium]